MSWPASTLLFSRASLSQGPPCSSPEQGEACACQSATPSPAPSILGMVPMHIAGPAAERGPRDQGTGPSRFSLVLLPMRPLPRAVGFVEGSRMWSAWRASACFGGQKPAANRLHRVVLASAACHSLGMPGGFLWARPRRRSTPCCVPGFQGSLAFVLRHPAEIRAASCSHHEKASASGRPYCSRCTRSCASAAVSWVFFSLSCRVNARQLGGWGWRLAAPCRMQPCSQTPPHVEAVSQTRPVGFAAAPAPAQSGTRVADTVSKPAAHSEPMARGSLTCKSLSNLSHSHRWARCNAAQRH